MLNKTSEIVLVAPPIETLFMRSRTSPWSTKILDNPDIIAHTTLRQKLHMRLITLFKTVPNPTTEILDSELCELLANFLDEDPHHRRLILYLPFELLPSRAPQTEHFVTSYMRCWKELLQESDVRANFVDGNILESELAPYGQKMVKKVAHLIPQLIRKGFVSEAEIAALANNTPDTTLKESIADALSTLSLSPSTENTSQTRLEITSLNELSKKIEHELKMIAMRVALDHSRNMPYARVAWEEKDKKEKLIVTCADILLDMTHARLIDTEEAISFLSRYSPDGIEHILVRWVHMGIIPEELLHTFNIELPRLGKNFSDTSRLAHEIRKFKGAILSIIQNAELEELLYPAAVFFGSRLKGYALQDADLDVAVFVKPNIPQEERPRIQKMLAELFKDKNIDGKIVEF
ncbi:MAG: nucleotidyltransferase domain-containing protein, partial [Patescibacteria group bacterium]